VADTDFAVVRQVVANLVDLEAQGLLEADHVGTGVA